MPNAYKRLYQGQLPNATGTLYTVPAATTTIIRHIRIVNTDTSARTFTFYHGGTGASNLILPDSVTINPGEWIEMDVQIYCAAGDVISGKADAAAKVTVSMYGIEMT
jgi:hypothetical protein